nr:hypothetical protein [uncultured Olsenella sp.]
MKARRSLAIVVVAACAIVVAAIAAPLAWKAAHTPSDDERQIAPRRADEAGVTLVAADTLPVQGNAAWCAPLQLCWDELLAYHNDGNPLEPTAGPNELVDALNGSPFEAGMVSDDHYYSYAGPMTKDARSTMEEAIDRRFGQRSDLLDLLDWESAEPDTTLFYAMLYRRFSFEHPFALLPYDGTFGPDHTEGARYFGTAETDGAERSDLLAQVTPLYYDDYAHCACRVSTKEGDELVLVKSPEGQSFSDMWDNTTSRTESAGAQRALGDDDEFECPLLSTDVFKEYDELEGLEFALPNGGGLRIAQAVQTLKFDLDNEGGRVKSEAAITAVTSAAPPLDISQPRHFVFDDRFALFLVDGNAPEGSRPYLAVLVDDVRAFQGQDA